MGAGHERGLDKPKTSAQFALASTTGGFSAWEHYSSLVDSLKWHGHLFGDDALREPNQAFRESIIEHG